MVIARDVLPSVRRDDSRSTESPLRILPVESLPPRLSLDEVLAFPEPVAPIGELPPRIDTGPPVDVQPVCLERGLEPTGSPEDEQHRHALSHLGKVAACFLLACGMTYLFDDLSEQRPWVQGEPIPVLRKVLSVDWKCALSPMLTSCDDLSLEDPTTAPEQPGELLAGLGVGLISGTPVKPAAPMAKTIAVAALATSLERTLLDEPVFQPTPLPKRRIGRATRIEPLNDYALDVFFDRLKRIEENHSITHARMSRSSGTRRIHWMA